VFKLLVYRTISTDVNDLTRTNEDVNKQSLDHDLLFVRGVLIHIISVADNRIFTNIGWTRYNHKKPIRYKTEQTVFAMVESHISSVIQQTLHISYTAIAMKGHRNARAVILLKYSPPI